MVKCSYCGEEGHTIQECPKWKGKGVASATSHERKPSLWKGKLTGKIYKLGETYTTIKGITRRIVDVREVDGTYYLINDVGAQLERVTPVTMPKPRTREDILLQMGRLLIPTTSEGFNVLASAMFSAYTTLGKGSPRRVFIQDFTASLNRKGILHDVDVEIFKSMGFEYMEM